MSDYRQHIIDVFERFADRTAEGMAELKSTPAIIEEFREAFFDDLADYESVALISRQIQELLHSWQLLKAISPEHVETALEMEWQAGWEYLHTIVTPEQQQRIIDLLAVIDARADELDDEGEEWKRGEPLA